MPEQKKFTLKLSEQAVKLIGDALANVPFKISAPLIGDIQLQIDEQLKADQQQAVVTPVE